MVTTAQLFQLDYAIVLLLLLLNILLRASDILSTGLYSDNVAFQLHLVE